MDSIYNFKDPSASDKSQEPSQWQESWTTDVGDAGRANKCVPCVTTQYGQRVCSVPDSSWEATLVAEMPKESEVPVDGSHHHAAP